MDVTLVYKFALVGSSVTLSLAAGQTCRSSSAAVNQYKHSGIANARFNMLEQACLWTSISENQLSCAHIGGKRVSQSDKTPRWNDFA
jgi:hypothetical protein